MKLKFTLIFCLFLGVILHSSAQTPVPEDLFDLYDDEDPGETDFDQNTNPPPDLLKIPTNREFENALGALDSLGSLGTIFSNAINSGKMTLERDCSSTFVCMYNHLKKILMIFQYEHSLSYVKSCEQKKTVLEDYSLFLLSMNLELYCIEHLRGEDENNRSTLSEEEIIDAMLAMGEFYRTEGIKYPNEFSRLINYRNINEEVNDICTNDVSLIKQDEDGSDSSTLWAKNCSCGEITGSLWGEDRGEAIMQIHFIIDRFNPLWQTRKAGEINRRLKELPCNN